MKKNIIAFYISIGMLFTVVLRAQLPVPTDYLTKEFHKGRREALRQLMPANSVMAVFNYPMRNFSNDVDYKYHPNPDLYYFSGYNEPNAVLLIFKEPQKDSAGNAFTELFFVQQRDPAREQWNGIRLGVEGVKTKLGFSHVYNGKDFAAYPIDLSKFDKVIYEFPKEINDDGKDNADVYDLVQTFKKKAAFPVDYNDLVYMDLASLLLHPEVASTSIIPKLKTNYEEKAEANESFKNNDIVNDILHVTDSASVLNIFEKIKNVKWSIHLYNEYTTALRMIKTPEELTLMRKAIDISCLAHNEAIKAVKPNMSELELQGVQEFIHKKSGAEDVGYPSIVGAGNNGCVLHYIENTVTKVGQHLILMDIGAEYHGYTADVTRTFPSNKTFSKEQKLIYDLVYKAQDSVFLLCKEGTNFRDLQKKAMEVVANGLIKLGIIKDNKDAKKYYPHGCSHYLGLDVHDKGDYKTLKENMVITVEPGIYIPEGSPCDKKWWGIAVRIEDDVRIDKTGYELMTHLSPRKTEDIEKLAMKPSIFNSLTLPVIK